MRRNPQIELATFAGLLLAVLLTIWLGISGPVDGSKLKDWQTSIAAFVALGAAVIAYRAAMAKVQLDRKLADQAAESIRLKLKIQLRHELSAFAREMRLMRTLLRTASFAELESMMVEPAGIQAAWEQVHALHPKIVGLLSRLRDRVHACRRLIAVANRRNDPQLTKRAKERLDEELTEMSQINE